MNKMHTIVPITLVFLACCSNVVLLELIISEHPSSGNIITFFQFLFIALEGFFVEAKCFTKMPVIPIRHYVTMVVLFFAVSVTNNFALNFHIPMPLHMIFKSGSLLANMALGIIILKRSYSWSKYLSVAMVTVGICICTIMSAKNMEKQSVDSGNFGEDTFWLVVGVVMLSFALIMSARLGIYQECLYKEFGKHPREALFYSHALPLPGFLILAKDVYSHIILFSKSAPLVIPFLGLSVPKMWLYMVGNVITQYICIRSVYILTSECTSLTVTLVITLRKFISLVVSIVYFQNPFTLYHWAGAAMVFIGTLIFVEVFDKIKTALVSKETKVE